MIKIEPEAWQIMVDHAKKAFPNECCGAMLGVTDDDVKSVKIAIPLENAFEGSQSARYELKPEDLLAADKAARKHGMDVIGIFHSHPDCDAYFSETDLKNSCPWYSFVVISIKSGEFADAKSFLPNPEQTEAPAEELVY